MIVRELAAEFRASAVEFQRLNPIDVFLLVRRVADPVESNDVAIQKLIDQNKLRDRFGQVHSCSVVEVGDEWEQCILLVDLRSNITRRAFDDWQEVVSHAAGRCQAASISPLFNRGHDSIVEFVMALEGELHNRKRTEFADFFKEKKGFEFDLTKGIVTSIEDTPKKSARLMEGYATRLGESSAVDAPKNQESGDNQGDGRGPRERLTPNDRCIWKAMLELNATALKPETGPTIVKAALYRGDAKRAFTRLIAWGFVGSKGGRGGGYWLTESGVNAVKTLL